MSSKCKTEFEKLHDKTIKQVLKYTEHLMDEGIKSTKVWVIAMEVMNIIRYSGLVELSNDADREIMKTPIKFI